MIRWIICGVLFFVALLICQIPASFVLSLVDTPKQLYITGVKGSVWNGQADAVTWDGQGVDQLEWRVSPLALVTGKLQLDVEAGSRKSPVKLSGRFSYGFSGLTAENVEVQFPAALIEGFYSLPAKVSGVIKGQVTFASQGEPWCEELSGEVNWFAPVLNSKMLGQPFVLDDTSAKLSCEQGKLVAEVSDQGNVLGLSAKAMLLADSYVVDGELNLGSDFPEKFKQGVGFFASPMGGDRYQISMDGKF